MLVNETFQYGGQLRLELYDVDTAALCLTVRLGKGQRDRIVPLTETSAYWLTRYVTVARPELAAGKLWGKGKRHNPPKIIPPTSAFMALRHGSSSLLSKDLRPHPRLRFASRSESLSAHLSPLLCDASSARRRQHSSCATAPGPSRSQHD